METEIERLPGCGVKIARLYQQWAITGSTEDTRGAETDTELAVLKMFYEIWGVGDVTARQFYNKGMSASERSLEDQMFTDCFLLLQDGEI